MWEVPLFKREQFQHSNNSRYHFHPFPLLLPQMYVHPQGYISYCCHIDPLFLFLSIHIRSRMYRWYKDRSCKKRQQFKGSSVDHYFDKGSGKIRKKTRHHFDVFECESLSGEEMAMSKRYFSIYAMSNHFQLFVLSCRVKKNENLDTHESIGNVSVVNFLSIGSCETKGMNVRYRVSLLKNTLPSLIRRRIFLNARIIRPVRRKILHKPKARRCY